MSTRDQDPDGLRLPAKIDTTSNGEFLRIPLSKANRLGNRTALEPPFAVLTFPYLEPVPRSTECMAPGI